MNQCFTGLFGEPQLPDRRIAVGDDIFKHRIQLAILIEDCIFYRRCGFTGLLCDKADPLARLGLVLPLADLLAALVLVDIL